MKNITLSADEQLIRSAREKAGKEHTSLNALFRQWLARYAEKGSSKQSYEELMKRLSYAHPGKKFTREEMNER
jgi:hypothetical protein